MGAPYYGDFPVNGVVFIPWNTNAQDGASITRSTDGTLKIYKGNTTHATWLTERTSLAGVVQTEDFDATGMHAISIDLSDNTDAGFYAAGNEYQVAISATTVDTKVVNAFIGSFSVERANGILALLKHATFGLSAIETLVDDLESRLGTPSDLGGGATIAANLVDIEGQTDDIGAAGAGLTVITGRLPAALVGGRMDSNTSAIGGTAGAATNLRDSANVLYVGSVTGAATTTTLIDSALTQADTDHWKGRIVIFLTGSLKYQATDITAFDPALDKLTFTALTNAPAGADTYVIV